MLDLVAWNVATSFFEAGGFCLRALILEARQVVLGRLSLTQEKQCSFFLGLLWFWVRDYNRLPKKKNYIGGSG